MTRIRGVYRMAPISRRELLTSLLVVPATLCGEEPWIPLFDGRSLHGWKADRSKSSFRIANGQIVVQGPPSHLFYTGGVQEANFKNLELQAEVRSREGAASGVCFSCRLPAQGLARKWLQGPGQQHLQRTRSIHRAPEDRLALWRPGRLQGVRERR